MSVVVRRKKTIMKRHIVLLGDSIFDNAGYVPGERCVIEQLKHQLHLTDQATLLAVDGNVAADVITQLRKLPDNATHLVLSVGGNDALGSTDCLAEPVKDVSEALTILAEIRESFHNSYCSTIEALRSSERLVCVCTIYEAIPDLPKELRTALALFNDTIVRAALTAGFSIIDLRQICTDVDDFSAVSSIEPSAKGGQKIADAIAKWSISAR
jgi:lysophospholipase L1-like esterase